MLEPSPDKRASAQRMLDHPWLQGQRPEVREQERSRRSSRRSRSRSRSTSAPRHKKSRY